MLEAMQDSDAGIPLQNFEIDQCIYKHCFTGLHQNIEKIGLNRLAPLPFVLELVGPSPMATTVL